MNDTHPKMARKRIEMLRALPPAERLHRTMTFSSSIMQMSRAAFQKRYGELGLQRWLETHYGKALAKGALGDRYHE
jgi:hypothetical protein